MAISSELLGRILAHAGAEPEREVCGLLLGTHDRITAATPAVNVAACPATRFELDPAALIAAHRAARIGGPAVLGHYHSHPSGRAEPSAHDRAMATGDALWLIVAGGEARLFRAGSWEAVPLRIERHGCAAPPHPPQGGA